jgi:predicted AlkP superfamily phosphohydrolase/phosphomutase
MSTPRTLIIGLDGATLTLIAPLVRAGYLPALGRLMTQGIYSHVQAWPNMNSEAGWTSLVTGYNPGQHSIYHLAKRTQCKDRWRPVTAADRKKDPFWCLLSAAGQRVGIINVPLSYPADPINGFMLGGMHTPGIHSPGFAHPPELCDELRRQGIDYVIDVPNLEDLCYRDPQRALREAQHMVDARSRTVLHLMKTHPWDVLLAVFAVTDILQHFFWPDEGSPVENDAWTPVRRIYQQIDSFLSEALALIDENTTVLVVSDHGFGPAHFGQQCLNQLFAQLGLLHYYQYERRLKSQLLKNLLLYGRRVIPYWLQDPLVRVFPRLHGQALHESKFSGIDWSHTQVFAHPYGGQVYINLEGREKEGIVPAEEYDPLRARVRDILLDLTDPTIGHRVVRAVYRREDLYHGPYLEQAADLLIEWEHDVPRDSLCYCAAGTSITVQSPNKFGRDKQVTGLHHPQGIFIACGPHIKRGVAVANATIYDIAPTILYLQDHPIPGDMDGKVLTDIFTEEHLRHHPVQQSEPASIGAQAAEADLDAKEVRKIEECLQGLGYIE